MFLATAHGEINRVRVYFICVSISSLTLNSISFNPLDLVHLLSLTKPVISYFEIYISPFLVYVIYTL